MTRLAITGHQGLPKQTVKLVDRKLRDLLVSLSSYSDPHGLSCLAEGPDQWFAQAVLDHGGRLDVVVPAVNYRDKLAAEAHATYDALFAKATEVHRLGFADSTSESHMAASQFMVDLANRLVAVWDGKPARGYGGTADVVAYAREVGTPVDVVWPPGASRD